MSLTAVERVLVERALATLVANPEHQHPAELIRRIAGAEAAGRIAALRKELVAANTAAKENGGALLSASAADYWQEAQSALSYGRMVYANPSPGRQTVLSRKCENLLASFEGRVPDNEKGKFRRYIDGDPTNWDDRWHDTRDGFFPLLESGFAGSVPVPNPAGEAQRTILADMLNPVVEDRSASVSRLGGLLYKYTEKAQAEEQVRRAKEARVSASSAKEQARLAKKAAHAAKVAAGDQKATKARRKGQYKVVPGIVSEPAAKGRTGP